MPGDLTAARLRLRRFSDYDVDWLARLHGDPAVMRFIDDGRPVPASVVADQQLPGRRVRAHWCAGRSSS